MSELTSLVLSIALTFAGATARETGIVQHINASGNITIDQPAALDKLLKSPAPEQTNAVEAADHVETSASGSTHATTRTGYRVQIFDDNNPRTARGQAEARHAQVKAAFPGMRSYIMFNSPYWRVKVGDFRTRAEAEAAMAELRHAFPSMAAYMRIVRDKINTYE